MKSNGGLKYQAGKLRASAEGLAKKRMEFIRTECGSVKTDTEAEKQAYQEEKRKHLGG